MSHDTLRRLVSDAYNTQSAGMTVGLPRVKVDASQLRALIAHYDSLIAERDTLRADVERMKAEKSSLIERLEWHRQGRPANNNPERDQIIERCAEVCEELDYPKGYEYARESMQAGFDEAREDCAAAIRALKESSDDR
jgi:uncharacterized coiled-coil DUF342 family protein